MKFSQIYCIHAINSPWIKFLYKMNCRTIFKLQTQRSASFRPIWNGDGRSLDTNLVPLGMRVRGET